MCLHLFVQLLVAPTKSHVKTSTPSLDITSLVVDAVADATGFESSEIDLSQSLSEELGIDSIRRTEILASVCDAGSFDSSSLDMEALSRAETVKDVIVAVEKELQGVSAPVRTVAVAPTQSHVKKTSAPSLDITSLVVDAVADATGFESSEIDLSQSLSEELGIDSIRRTEILASVCDAGSFDSSSLDMEALSRAETVKDVIVAVEKELQGVSAPVCTTVVAPTQSHVKKTSAPSLDITSLVVDAVADATGFESSEIDLSQSLSEELGIDSIRRTEILASVCDAGSFDSSSLDMEALSRAETVKDVIVAVEKELQGVSAPVRTTVVAPTKSHVKTSTIVGHHVTRCGCCSRRDRFRIERDRSLAVFVGGIGHRLDSSYRDLGIGV